MKLLARARGLQGGVRPIRLASREKVGNVRTVEGGGNSRLATEKSSRSLITTGSHRPANCLPGRLVDSLGREVKEINE